MNLEDFKKGLSGAKKPIEEDISKHNMAVVPDMYSPHRDLRPGSHNARVLDTGKLCRVCEKPLYVPTYYSFKSREKVKTCSLECARVLKLTRFNSPGFKSSSSL